MALAMLACLPEKALQIIRDESFKGGPLICLDCEVSRPTYKDSLSSKSSDFICKSIWPSLQCLDSV